MEYRYGLITYEEGKAEGWNYGDTIQSLAIEEIYQMIGIEKQQIEKICIKDISNYHAKGDYKVILPMQGCLEYSKAVDVFPVSEDIIPVYIGFSRISGSHNKTEYYKQYEPIGCRDEQTMNKLKKKNIQAYISGCLTICFPKREREPEKGKGKIFLVDQPKGIEQFIPDEMRERVVYVTHESDNNIDLEKKSRELLAMYSEEAELVVTSRLHCASPCIGMGIPVILAREYFDPRYQWIDKFLKLYTRKEFSRIDWNPKIVELEEIKEELIELFRRSINFDEQLNEKAKCINDFYSNRNRGTIETPFKTRMYWLLLRLCPKLAYFLRKKVFRRFSVLNDK